MANVLNAVEDVDPTTPYTDAEHFINSLTKPSIVRDSNVYRWADVITFKYFLSDVLGVKLFQLPGGFTDIVLYTYMTGPQCWVYRIEQVDTAQLLLNDEYRTELLAGLIPDLYAKCWQWSHKEQAVYAFGGPDFMAHHEMSWEECKLNQPSK
jgi:hypothetical protein